MDFNTTPNDTMADSLTEGYVTAEEETPTRYLSVLETSEDITLSDLNATLSNSKTDFGEQANEEGESEELNTVNINGQQVVVFTIDGRDELYGIQFVQDDQGNLQKYQFQLRTNEEGQLEAIPETITLLPLDEETETVQDNFAQEAITDDIINDPSNETLQQITDELNEQVTNDFAEECHTEPVQLNSPTSITDHVTQVYHQDELHDLGQNEQVEEELDTKTGIIEEHYRNIKQEMFHEELAVNPEVSQEYENASNNIDILNGKSDMSNMCEDHLHETKLHINIPTAEDQTNLYLNEDITENTSKKNAQEAVAPYEEIFVEESPHIEDNDNNQQIVGYTGHHLEDNSEEANTSFNQSSEDADNDSDNDDYHIVEGLHITGDVEEGNPVSQETLPGGTFEKTYTDSESLDKQFHIKNVDESDSKNHTKTFYYYLVRQTEKENLDSITILNSALCKPLKANPRSILKNSHIETIVPAPQTFQSERFSKRFARSKEAKEERLFMNFINQTTIPVEPVRKNRLPRKQKIKPIQRMDDEEIVVQEVVVSSNGFVETLEDGILKSKEPLKVTATVTLTDTDDDYDPKQGRRKKRKNRKHRERIEITISDSSDSDQSIIEVLSDSENAEQNDKNDVDEKTKNDVDEGTKNDDKKGKDDKGGDSETIVKRGKGRPRKKVENRKEGKNSKLDVSLKRTRGQNSKLHVNESQDDSGSPAKKSKTDDSEDSLTSKNEFSCPECDKSFASQNSLKTHLQHHNLEKSIENARLTTNCDSDHDDLNKNPDCNNDNPSADASNEVNSKDKSQTEVSRPSEQPPPSVENKTPKQSSKIKVAVKTKPALKPRMSKAVDKPNTTVVYKHKCNNCDATFKNSILLNRHVCPKKVVNKFDCSLCKKTFPDFSKLNIHKRTHIKENLVKTTSAVKVSPKKVRASVPASTSTFKSPKKVSTFKCKDCGKICSSLTILNAHVRSHKNFTCPTCKTKFASRILLDTHVREKCVKTSSPHNKRLSFKTKKTFSPRSVSARFSTRASTRRSSISSQASNTSVASTAHTSFLQVQCDSCHMKFSSHSKLFDHKVLKHGLNTPDKKRILDKSQKKTLYKQRGTFGGVPASAKLSSAYVALKSKFDDLG